jgi:hypothetical protein
MKITRRQLRKLIAEAIDESRRYIDNPDGGLTRADRAYQSADQKDTYAASLHPKLPVFIKSPDIETRAQGRELADSIVDIDRLTPEEETAIDHMGYQRAFEADKGLEQVIDKEALYGAMKSRSKAALRYFGFMYIEDIPHLVPETDYEDHGDTFRFQAQVLGCDIEDLAFVDSEEGYKTQLVIYDMIRAMKPTEIPIPDDDGYHGNNKLYDLGGFKVLLTGHMGGYYTITICGK